MTHTCACHYGPDGRCIWCHCGQPDKHPHAIPGVDTLPPPVSLGTKSTSTYIPFSSWGRAQARRSAIETLGADFLAATEDDLDWLSLLNTDRRGLDKIVGVAAKLTGKRPPIKAGHL